MKIYNSLSLGLCCLGLVPGVQGSVCLASGHEHPAQVHVWQENLPDKVVYHYRVSNLADRVSIPTVVVGYDYYHGVPVLTSRPARIRSPQGWTGQIISTEESHNVEVEWSRNDSSHSIQPGRELRGFALEVPTANDSYRSFYTLYFGDGRPASSKLLRDTAHRRDGIR